MQGAARRLLVAVLLAAGMLGTATATATATPTPSASGAPVECDGGLVYRETVTHARAVVVGKSVSIGTDSYGLRTVTSVRVERTYRIRTPAVWHGTARSGWCPDRVEPGARVIVLLGVDLPGKDLDGNWYYVVGGSVAQDQVASIGASLPDSDAAPPSMPSPLPGQSAPWPIGLALAVGFMLAWRRTGRLAASRWRR